MKLKQKSGWWLTVLVSGIILSSIFFAPLAVTQWPRLARFIYFLFSPLCHQQPERSYFLNGQQLAVCSRCLGIYSGFFFSSLAFPLWSISLRRSINSKPFLIVLLAIPLGLDFLLNLLKFWSSPLLVRTITGFIWSAILPFYWFKALEEFSA